MSTQSLPIVPFGKYKGKPVTDLLADPKYLEWCKQQSWFEKYQVVYNICVNQTISSNDTNSNTPAHNKLQNMFLREENVKKLVKLLYPWKNTVTSNFKCEFEASYNWDAEISDLRCTRKKSLCNECKIDNTTYCDDCEYINGDEFEEPRILPNIYMELKPQLGDDYPCVLRKMKTQISLTMDKLKKEKQEILAEAGYVEGKQQLFASEELRDAYKFINTNYEYFLGGKYVLLVQNFESNSINKDDLKRVFNQTHIRIIFVNELFDDSLLQIRPETSLTLAEDNQFLQEKLSQAEEKIKQLEKQLLLLTSQPSNKQKTLKEYFGKK